MAGPKNKAQLQSNYRDYLNGILERILAAKKSEFDRRFSTE
jgi:hypothetical protein